ncbi:hypothetical protein Thiowin_02316 [Thiorhodovibrio winogradskyi]|uniref:Uncharacterized protein n=1 Tax=Thiorhodovibrio winogradskyi TaxID=77007 RepID=A0ABZ0S9J4_9GAMM
MGRSPGVLALLSAKILASSHTKTRCLVASTVAIERTQVAQALGAYGSADEIHLRLPRWQNSKTGRLQALARLLEQARGVGKGVLVHLAA